MSDKNIKELLLKHVDKLAIGLVLFIIVVYLVSLATGTSEAEKLAAQAREISENINESLETADKPEPLEINYADDIQKPFLEVTKAGRQPRWFSFKRPYVLRSAEFIRPGTPVHLKPELAAEKSMGQVKLSWVDNPGNKSIDLLGYTLRRREGDEGKWLKLKDFDKDTHEYIDKTVAPDTKYDYRLTSRAKKVERSDVMPLDNPEMESDVVTIETPFNLEFNTKRMIWSGEINDPSAVLRIRVTINRPGGTESESVNLKRGDKIVVRGIQTDWTLKDFGEKKLAPGKTEKYVIIVNSEGKTKRIPPAQKESEEGQDKSEGDDSEEPDKSGSEEKENSPGDTGGGWLPPDK